MRTPTLSALAATLLLALAGTVGAKDPSGEDPYILEADVHPARAPGAYDEADDCAPPEARQRGGLLWTLRQLRPPEGLHTWPGGGLVPKCVAADTTLTAPCGLEWFAPCGHPLLASPVPARASYNVTSGDYAVVVGPEDGGAPILEPPAAASAKPYFRFSGNAGVGFRADCEECPPPYVLR